MNTLNSKHVSLLESFSKDSVSIKEKENHPYQRPEPFVGMCVLGKLHNKNLGADRSSPLAEIINHQQSNTLYRNAVINGRRHKTQSATMAGSTHYD